MIQEKPDRQRVRGNRLEEGEGLVQGQGGGNWEVAAAGADEAGEMGAGAEGFAQVAGESADVSALGASDSHYRLREPKGRCVSHMDT